MKCLDVMPCNKFRFLEMPLYYYGHALPSPIVSIILSYAYQMTVLEDGLTLGDKLEEMLSSTATRTTCGSTCAPTGYSTG